MATTPKAAPAKAPAKKPAPKKPTATAATAPSPRKSSVKVPSSKKASATKSASARKPSVKLAVAAAPKLSPAERRSAAAKSAIKVVVKDGQRVKVSTNGIPLGRPKTDMPELDQIQSRIPSNVNDYLKFLSMTKLADQPEPFRTLQAMFHAMFTRFLEERPWEHGYPWHDTQSSVRHRGTDGATSTIWRQVNIRLLPKLVKKIALEAKRANRSESSFAYTAICWWCGFLYPPTGH